MRYVLVHGVWHGGWCWERVARELASRGHDVAAPDLPSDQPGLTQLDYAALRGTDWRFLLLSFGGFLRDEHCRSCWPDLETAATRLYPDCDRTTAAWAFAQLRPQARLDLHAGELRPVDVAIACTRDAAVDLESFAGVVPRVVELDAGHFPMFTHPRELVDALEEVSLVRSAGETDQRLRGDS